MARGAGLVYGVGSARRLGTRQLYAHMLKVMWKDRYWPHAFLGLAYALQRDMNKAEQDQWKDLGHRTGKRTSITKRLILSTSVVQ